MVLASTDDIDRILPRSKDEQAVVADAQWRGLIGPAPGLQPATRLLHRPGAPLFPTPSIRP
jgi:hypothetical protein